MQPWGSRMLAWGEPRGRGGRKRKGQPRARVRGFGGVGFRGASLGAVKSHFKGVISEGLAAFGTPSEDLGEAFYGVLNLKGMLGERGPGQG